MKKINTCTVIFAGILFVSQQANAQAEKSAGNQGSGIVYSAGINGAIATGKFTNTHQWGLGGTIGVDIPINQKLYGTANAGFLNFFDRNLPKNNNVSKTTDAQFLPIQIGLKYFLTSILYVQGEAGVSIALNKDELNYDRSVAFTYAPQVGIRWPLSKKNNLDLGVLYERSAEFRNQSKESKVDYFSLKVAYPFSL